MTPTFLVISSSVTVDDQYTTLDFPFSSRASRLSLCYISPFAAVGLRGLVVV